MKIEYLFESWKGQCAYCGIKLKLKQEAKEKRATATRDHFIPLAAGGGKGKRNHVLSCQPCNSAKGSVDPRVIVKVWHQLDAKSLSAYVENLQEPKSKTGLAGRIKALLRTKSRRTKRLH